MNKRIKETVQISLDAAKQLQNLQDQQYHTSEPEAEKITLLML